MIAVSAGRNSIASYLLSKGAQVNAVNSNGQSSLHYAASKDRFEVMCCSICINVMTRKGSSSDVKLLRISASIFGIRLDY